MSEPQDIQPPRWPLKFLRLVVKKEYLEEIEGDMEEIFQDHLSELTPRQARLRYTVEMLKLLRPVLMRNLAFLHRLNQTAMFRNYFKVSLRGLMKNPLNAFINVFGLSIAIGIAIFAYGFANWTYSTDQFHKNKNEVFLVTFYANREGAEQEYGTTPRPLGELMKADFAHINKVCRVEDRNAVVKKEDQVYQQRIRFTDPSFLEMFTFPLKWGTPQALNDVNSMILSERMSEKYFGEANPLGQTIRVIFSGDHSKDFKIMGVAKKFPLARTIAFDFLINIDNFRTIEPAYNFNDWNANVNATLIQVDKPENIGSIALGMDKYKKMQNEAASEDWEITSFGFEPLATLHERSEFIRDGISRSSGDNYKSVIYLVVIGIFMLALACFNYINIAIVSAARRLKEIGVRKSIGATRFVVIIQFLTENIVITTFALLVGLALGGWVFIPWFEQQWNFQMGFSLLDKNLWIYLPILLIITGIASGSYPAFYISKFQVAGIMKGAVTFSGKNSLTKLLLTFQLILACIFMTCAIVFTQNSDFLAQQSWGYDQHETLYARIPNAKGFDQLAARISQDPDVLSVAASEHQIGKNHELIVIHLPDREYEVDGLNVSPLYLQTMGLQLASGRMFNDHEGSDRQAVIVNELLAKNLSWKEPLGQTFNIDSISYEVIGVVKDFHNYSFFEHIHPMIFRVAEKDNYRYLALKAREGAQHKVYGQLRTDWTQLFPEVPFDGGYQEDVWGGYTEASAIYTRVFRSFAAMAVLLAALGLYGLVKLNVSGREREFSIRKVLGAGLSNITANILNQYLILFGIALVIGVPLSYRVIKYLLDVVYKVHMPITYAGVTMAASLLVLVLLATTATQIHKVLRSNPVNGLKAE